MNAWIGPLETWFDQIALSTWPLLAGHEGLTLKLDAEDQHYLRFNAGRIRQATAVRQIRLRLDYQSDQRQCSHTLTLTGQIDHDRATVASTLDIMRQESRALPVDPWIIPLHHHGSSHIHHPGTWPEVARLVEDITECGQGDDFAGLLALGTMVRANRNSLGQAHWYSSENLFFDYSLYTVNPDGENKAVKGFYAGSEWDQNRHKRLWVNQQDALKRLKQRNHTVSPGDYRVYLAPAAVDDLIGMCSWGGTSYRAFREGRSALGRLFENKTSFSPLFTLKENFTPGLAPRFNSLGELSPECLTIIDRGQPGSLLVSARSAAEYGVDSNAAEPGSEGMRSPELMPGELEESQILKALGKGLYVSNLHYLNWSDIPEARVTGMTRYACFWVEGGEIIAPIGDLRFDDSLYRIFGSQLEALTAHTERCMNTDTYGQRSLGGSQIPGALIGQFRFTL